LDLRSGSGRDSFPLSALGVDMTGEKLNTANRPIDYHAKVFAYLSTNVEFRKRKIEKLDEVELADESLI